MFSVLPNITLSLISIPKSFFACVLKFVFIQYNCETRQIERIVKPGGSLLHEDRDEYITAGCGNG